MPAGFTEGGPRRQEPSRLESVVGKRSRQREDSVAWLLKTTNSMVSCRTVASLLDLAYDAIRQGLGYDRVGLNVIDLTGTLLEERIGTDAQGRKFYPRERHSRLSDGDYYARLLGDPRFQVTGSGFIYMENASRDVPASDLTRLDGRPRQNLRVALRSPERLIGWIAVDNLLSERPIRAADAPPLVAFANALAAALENVRVLEEREQRIGSLDAGLRQRVDQLVWLQHASMRLALLHELEDVLDSVCTLARDGLGYDQTVVALIEPGEGKESRLVAIRELDESGALRRHSRTLSFRPGDPSLARQWPALHQLLHDLPSHCCPDGALRCAPKEDAQPGAPVCEQLVAALRQEERLLGYISVSNRPGGRATNRTDTPALVAFAAQAALAISRARLWAEHTAQGKALARRVAELEWLREISRQVNAAASLDAVLDVVYDGIRSGLGYDRVGIDLLHAEADSFVEYRGTDAAGHKTCPTARAISLNPESALWTMPSTEALLRGAEFFYTADAYSEWPEDMRYVLDGAPRQMLQVPLRSSVKLIGIISVDNLLTGKPIVATDAAPLLALANQVATAVENARLRELERAERARLERASLTDYLTDLGNYRAFQEQFSRAAMRARQQREPLALALVDIDHFKVVNDRHGHSQGDRVLAAVGEMLRRRGGADGAFRLGGDEFALILPATTLDAAVRLAEQLCREAELALNGATLSIGVASAPALGGDLQSLREDADAALYEAKRGGRNRVVVYAEVDATASWASRAN